MVCQRRSVTVLALSLFALISVASGKAHGFTQGRPIKILVSYFPGGGYDLYTRVLARHLPKYFPGEPSIIVQNMPGAGSIIGANYLYRIAPRDGTVIGTFGPTQVVRQVIGMPGIAFESDRFNWLAAANAEDVITCLARAEAGVENLDDAVGRPQPLIVAATAPASSTSIWAKAYKEILGANFKIVPGYRGTAGIRAAMEQGEVDAGCWQWSSVKVTAEPMLAARTAVVFTQLGMKKAPDLLRVDNALDRARTKAQKSILTALLTEISLGRPYAAPPDVAEDRIEILRGALMNALQDPKLLEEANRLGLEIHPLSGQQLQTLISELKNLPRESKEKIREIMD